MSESRECEFELTLMGSQGKKSLPERFAHKLF